jgi:hypothetical protein
MRRREFYLSCLQVPRKGALFIFVATSTQVWFVYHTLHRNGILVGVGRPCILVMMYCIVVTRVTVEGTIRRPRLEEANNEESEQRLYPSTPLNGKTVGYEGN